MGELRRRARLAYVEGAGEESQRLTARAPTPDQLDRILRRYPGDPG
jgi:hypothetical protein